MFRKLAFLTVLMLTLAFSMPASAGRLFPPEGLNPTESCPTGQVLKWTGSGLICGDPTPGVNVTACPSGQVLKGISNGSPNCVADATGGGAITVSNCPAGQVLRGVLNGNPTCVTDATGGAINVSNCSSGKVMTGISNGKATCASVSVTVSSCPAGQALKGITNGSADCVDIRPHTAGVFMVSGTAPSGTCRYVNKVTGGCSCPKGYSPARSWEFVNPGKLGGLYCDGGSNPSCTVMQYTCYKD